MTTRERTQAQMVEATVELAKATALLEEKDALIRELLHACEMVLDPDSSVPRTFLAVAAAVRKARGDA